MERVTQHDGKKVGKRNEKRIDVPMNRLIGTRGKSCWMGPTRFLFQQRRPCNRCFKKSINNTIFY